MKEKRGRVGSACLKLKIMNWGWKLGSGVFDLKMTDGGVYLFIVISS